MRAGLDVARATDILLVLLSADTYNALRAGRGWAHADIERWLLLVITEQLLPARA